MKYITFIDIGNWTFTSLIPFIGFMFFLDVEINSFAFNSLKGISFHCLLIIVLICGISFIIDFFSIKYSKSSLSKFISYERKKKGFKEFKLEDENAYKDKNPYKLKKKFIDLLRLRENYFNKCQNHSNSIIPIENKDNQKELCDDIVRVKLENLSEDKLILSDNLKIFKKSQTLDKLNNSKLIDLSNNKINENISANKISNIYTENENFLIERDNNNINFRQIRKKSLSLMPGNNIRNSFSKSYEN